MKSLVDLMHIAVRSHRRDREHERLICTHSIVKEAVGFGSNEVRGVFAFVRHRCVSVSLECSVEILVGERVK